MKKTILAALLVAFGGLVGSQALAHGAAAISEDGDKIEICVRQPTKWFAESCAKDKCGAGCKVITTFRSKCVALVEDEAGERFQVERYSQEEADELAVADCERKGDGACRLIVRACDKR